MQRTLIAIGIAGAVFLGVITGSSGKMPQVHLPIQTHKTPDPTAVISPTDTPIPQAPTPAVPRVVSIPSIGITTAIQPVGMDAQGKMAVPDGWDVVGWYNLGYRPGQQGSAVLDGHLDDPNGQPAVFWNIKTLRQGDTITITDNNNQTYTFVVTDVESYPFDGAPLQQIFNTADKPRLNLITCAGTWDRAAHNYSNRTVVYSELQQ